MTTTQVEPIDSFSDTESDYYDYGYEYDYVYEYLQDDSNCSIYSNALKKIEELEQKKCSEFVNDGYKCVPFQACKDGEIVTNGAG